MADGKGFREYRIVPGDKKFKDLTGSALGDAIVDDKANQREEFYRGLTDPNHPDTVNMIDSVTGVQGLEHFLPDLSKLSNDPNSNPSSDE